MAIRPDEHMHLLLQALKDNDRESFTTCLAETLPPGAAVTPLCCWCGEPEALKIADVWLDSEFLLDTCCQGMLDSVSAGISDDPAWGRDLLRRLGAEALTGHRLRRVSDGQGCHPMLDWQLDLRPIGSAPARAFIARHHVRRPSLGAGLTAPGRAAS